MSGTEGPGTNLARHITRGLCLALAILGLRVEPAAALDPHSSLTDYSLTNWFEDAGPFPFGVYAIAQDQEGYLWLGARTGLIRFDGIVFKNWSGSVPLPDDRVSAICVGRDGSLWLGFGTIGGVTRIRRGQVTNFRAQDGVTAGDVSALFEDDDGAIWAATYGGLSRFADDHWTHIGAQQGLPAEPVLSLLKDSRKNFWVGTSFGVYRRRPNEDRFQFVAPMMVIGFAEDATGTIWVSDREKGFAVLDRTERHADAPAEQLGALGRSMLYDRSGSLWVGTRGSGLLRVHPPASLSESASIEKLTRHEGLPSNEIRCLFEDRQGTLWIGTRMGLSRLKESNVRPSLAADDAFVTSVTSRADGNVWIGTSEGVRRRSGEHEQIYSVKDGLPSQVVTALYEDPGGTLWAATTKGIARFTGRRFVALEGSQETRLSNVQSMTSDRNGVLWICDQLKGLMQWKNGKLTSIDEGFTREGPPYAAYTDADDRVWIGLWTTGIAVYKNNSVERYSVDDGLPPGTVNVVYQDRRGAIWVGTSKGLGRFENGRFVTFTSNGFPQSAVVSIVEDDKGCLWFGLPAGLVRISLEEFATLKKNPGARLRYKVYGTEEGVPGTLGRPGMPSSTRGGDGRLWFVTSVGFAVVNPHQLRPTPAPGPVQIEDVVADGVVVKSDGPLRLPPRTSRVQIEYSILNLAAVGKLRFRYKLEDFDSDWQDAGDRRQASYTNLPPGTYRFRVGSSNSEGGWSESGDVLSFSIQPAIYQTTAFDIAIFAAVMLAIWAVWQFRLRNVQRRFDLVLAERVRMGREIHDTLLQSLVGVALEFDDIWEQLDPSAHTLRTQVQRIREQVEHYIREARHSIWNLRSPMLETNDLPLALRHAGEAAVSGSSARFDFVVSGTPRRAASRVEEELLRVGQEALSNAVRHASATTVRVDLFYELGFVRLRVADDGRGFDQARIGEDGESHWGITNMRERAQQVGARFELLSHVDTGTTVEMIAVLPPVTGNRQ